MNRRGTLVCVTVILIIWAIIAPGARATVFTTNTAIGPFTTTYDGTDLVVSNCTVTVDGPHSFASVQVAAGGVLTHSAFPGGSSTFIFNVTNEVQTLSSTNPATLLNTNVSLPIVVTDIGDDITYTNGVDYVTLTTTNDTTELLWTNTSAIPNGATVLVSYSWTESVAVGLTLTVGGNVNVAAGGRIDASGNGYASGLGTGHGSSSFGYYADGAGAGYGGNGGFSASNAVGGVCYGSVAQPNALGSGGGASYAGTGGSGGGLVQIFAGGNINVDGVLLANGMTATNSRAGGGSGGSIWLSATNLSGAGTIAANGGAGEPTRGGGGGGGRISIQCGTNNFAGSLTACGGTGWETGGAGTIFIQATGQDNLLLVDNGGQTGTNSTVVPPQPTDVVIRGNAGVISSGAWVVGNLTIASNSVLGALAQTTLNLNITGALDVQAGGQITADGLGYPASGGSGAGHSYTDGQYDPCSGGSYGGYGALPSPPSTFASATYGIPTGPGTFGSGGGTDSPLSIGGPGGGAMQIFVDGPLQLDGRISANGGNGSGTGGGGGSGGSIYLDANGMAGGGTISANGGNGAGTVGGGGGGGRIAIYCTTNSFSGALTAAGGGGANWGGAGTIYQQQSSPSLSQLILDNAGHSGTNTPLSSASSANLIIRNGAMGVVTYNSVFASLTISTNGWLAAPAPGYVGNLILTVDGNATIQPGGGIIANATGGSSSAGYYSSFPYSCGGGGHGGAGGNSAGNLALGGLTVESLPTMPVDGGGNGGTYLPYSIGGLGGGAIELVVSGILQLNGLISANGGNGAGDGGGGGAGGSIFLNSSTLTGTGSITANGGSGVAATGGGGGGGCIAAIFSSNSFAGTITAYGGGGANFGGAGTIYLKTNSVSHGTVIVDNGGNVGAYSLPVSSSIIDVTLQNGGMMYAASSQFSSLLIGNLTINSNAWLIVSNASLTPPETLTVSVGGNATVQAGGGISADLAGYHAGSGTGAGGYYGISPYYPGGGAGHGGYGANGFTNSTSPTGGTAGFDSYSSPVDAGAGGGGSSPYSVGGNGGGGLKMSVTGTLQLNGSLSANGGAGSGAGGGGGAGGSLALTLGGLTGSGTMAANGGSGVSNIGGGGGGGIISVSTSASNVFAGTISASGGAGATYGGAGLIYILTNNVTGDPSVLIVDNAGHRGTNTPLPSVNSSTSVILRNGSVVFPVYGQTIASLLLSSNAWLVGGSVNNNPGDVYLTVTGGATIQPGSGIFTDGENTTQTSGRGLSSPYSPSYQCSGGGHGGYGGLSMSNSAAGGNTYDSSSEPASSGSSGGSYSPNSTGGAGGGFVSLHVTGALQVYGTISANGANGTGSGGGGGSGGGINLNAGILAGTGGITANGGNGALNYGGGGGGGRVAVYFNTNSFTGIISAYGGGGGGTNYGGAGTVYYQTNNQARGLLLLDNNNNAGTNTTFDFSTVNVTIQNRAIGYLSTASSWEAYNVVIRTNGILTAAAISNVRTIDANSITIDPGGLLSLDGAGFAYQQGTGAGTASATIRGGGSHGGYGGGNGYGGAAYDSMVVPLNAGSGGATYTTGDSPAYGGYGGGAVELFTPLITVNGRLTANGLSGGNGAGGGAGGSLYFPEVNILTGSGVISANGGSATGSAGGGGGGRIAIICTSNNFTGQFSASGGTGTYPGGAGTIYTRVNGRSTLTVDNGGILNATNTPYSTTYSPPAAPYNLTISGGAVLIPVTPLPVLSNLTINASSTLTVPSPETTLSLAVLNNFNLTGSLTLDSEGYPLASGPGAGRSLANEGAGGGYGGTGGSSANGAVGGTNYGSATQPVDYGSAGGSGVNTVTGGSSGGGAARISVGGTFTVNGTLSANGQYGWQDNSGGGSGGSLWLTARTLAGGGTISVAGGSGNPDDGGGGGGGRIAIYAVTNDFTGTTNASGGIGDEPGQAGTIFLASDLANFQVTSQTPEGIISNVVNAVDLTFDDALAPNTVTTEAFTVTTPSGSLPQSSITVSIIGLYTVQLSFPIQDQPGNYTVQAAGSVGSVLGQPLGTNYIGAFTISLPTVSGTVTDTNNAPVAGVTLQPNGGLPGVSTDTNGNYSFGVPWGWNGTVTPSLGTEVFVPSSLSYTNLTASLSGQNYLMVPTASPGITTSLNDLNLTLNWAGIPGVTYQAMWSTNLVDWTVYGSPLAGTNGLMQLNIPLDTEPSVFFRLSLSY